MDNPLAILRREISLLVDWVFTYLPGLIEAWGRETD